MVRRFCQSCGAEDWGECPEHKKSGPSRWRSLGIALGMVTCIGAFVFGIQWALESLAAEFGRDAAIMIAIGAMLTVVFYGMARHEG